MDNMEKQPAVEEKESFFHSLLMSVEPVLKAHLGVLIGASAGVILAVCILLFGFWNMMFVIILAAVGAYVGYKIDRKEDILPSLPPAFKMLTDKISEGFWSISKNRWNKKKRLL